MSGGSKSKSNQETTNSSLTEIDNSVDNSVTDNSQWTDASTYSSADTYDSSYTDNSTFQNSQDYIDNSTSADTFDSSYNDSSTYNSADTFDSSYTDASTLNSADTYDSSYTDNSEYFNDQSYTDNSVVNYLDGGAIAAGKDVSLSAIQTVETMGSYLLSGFNHLATTTERATDSALKVASNVALEDNAESIQKMTLYIAVALGAWGVANAFSRSK